MFSTDVHADEHSCIALEFYKNRFTSNILSHFRGGYNNNGYYFLGIIPKTHLDLNSLLLAIACTK